MPQVTLLVNDRICLKDPESSDLGKKIIESSIDMIYEVGLEQFTFKKLADAINSTEASIYRYFENKHKLLLYLTSWYWSWMEYKLAFKIANVESAHERLKRAVSLLTEQVVADSDFSHINEVKLHQIVISESAKAFFNKQVDEVNKSGVFASYKSLVQKISEIVEEINPSFKYPHMLISTIAEGAHHQRFFAEHLPRLTDVVDGEDAIQSFYQEVVFKTINA